MSQGGTRQTQSALARNGATDYANGAASDVRVIAEEDEHRAAFYAFLGHLFLAPPSSQLLKQIRHQEGDDTPFGAAMGELAAAADAVSPEEIKNEFDDLFVGIPQAPLMPYASYYITGGLFGRPLAKLRMNMAELGIARSTKATEPEDHMASICEMMAGLIMGRFGHGPASVRQQREFFEAHLSEWADHFFSDLEASGDAKFYSQVARVALLFIAMERQAFAMS